MESKKYRDFTGREFDSVSEMCRHYDISTCLYKHRIKHGWGEEKSIKNANKEQ